MSATGLGLSALFNCSCPNILFLLSLHHSHLPLTRSHLPAKMYVQPLHSSVQPTHGSKRGGSKMLTWTGHSPPDRPPGIPCLWWVFNRPTTSVTTTCKGHCWPCQARMSSAARQVCVCSEDLTWLLSNGGTIRHSYMKADQLAVT